MEPKTTLDPRLNAFRADLADIRLQGRVVAARFVAGQRHLVAGSIANLHRAPRFDAPLDTQALHGETVIVFEESEGWAWCQLGQDGYVGYIPAEELTVDNSGRQPTGLDIVQVTALQALAFAAPDIKTPNPVALPLGSRLRVAARDGDFLRLSNGRFVHRRHIDGTSAAARDHVDVALRMVGAPYLWGGKTSLGIDCSGLVQLALQTAGMDCPRDSYMQEADDQGVLGTVLPLHNGELPDLMRGDLLFWPGHVGIVGEAGSLLHATAHQMAVVVEPLEPALARIAAKNKLRTVRRPGSASA